MLPRRSKKQGLGLAITASLCVHALCAGIIVYIVFRPPVIGLGTDEGDAFVTTYIVSTGEASQPVIPSEARRAKSRDPLPLKIQDQGIPPLPRVAQSVGMTEKQLGSPGAGETGMPGDKVQLRRGKDDKRLRTIWRKINRSKYYPKDARRAGMEGSPRVRFSIGEDGSITTAALAASCGIPELDVAAVQTVHNAAPLPHYPKPITLAIKYSLNK